MDLGHDGSTKQQDAVSIDTKYEFLTKTRTNMKRMDEERIPNRVLKQIPTKTRKVEQNNRG